MWIDHTTNERNDDKDTHNDTRESGVDLESACCPETVEQAAERVLADEADKGKLLPESNIQRDAV